MAGAAAGIHVALTPEHFAQRTVYGLFFLGAAAFQVALAWLLFRRPGPRVYRAGALGSLGLIVTWIVTRTLAPAFAKSGAVEPVTLLGVVATGAELATLFLLASALPAGARGRRRGRRAWSAAAGFAFTALFLLASSAVSYVPWVAKDLPHFQNVYGGFTWRTPFIIGMPLPHIWIVGAWSSFALIAVAGVLVTLNTAVAMGPRAGGAGCTTRRSTLFAAAPAFFAVSSCCGAPVALFLGVGTAVSLARVSSWLLVATVGMLGANLALLLRRLRQLPRQPVRQASAICSILQACSR